MLDGRRPGRHSRPACLQLRARGHLARGLEALPRLGVPPRFRAQRPEHLPHLPHDAGRLAAVQERCRSARPRALRLGGARRCATATPPRCGRWRSTCAAPIDGREKIARPAAGDRTRVRTGEPDRHAARSVPCCYGRRGARSGGWRRGRPTSRAPSSSGATGRSRRGRWRAKRDTMSGLPL